MHYYLGADQTLPAAPFVRLIAPTDIQKVSARMSQIIKDRYAGIDILNLDLWRKLGATTLEGPVVDFLTRLIGIERERRETLTEENRGGFRTLLVNRYEDYYRNPVDVGDYIDAFIQATREGQVPQSILQPWDYQPTSVTQDVAAAATGSLKALAPLLLGAVAIYAAISVFLPNVIGSVSASLARRR